MMPLSCPVCNSQSRFEQRSADANLYRCPACDHCFSDLSSIGELEAYGSEYFQKVHKNWFSHPNLPLFRKISATIRQHKPNASVLDLGCGNGDLLRYLHRTNPALRLCGIDLARNVPEDGIEFIQGDVLTAKLDRQFDVMTSLAVIEHVSDVRLFVTQIERTCAPGGLLLVMTLNDRSVLYEVARIGKKVGLSSPYDRLYSKHHVNHFNTSSLPRLLNNKHFQVLEVLRHNAPLAAIDFEAPSKPIAAVMKAGVWGTFVLGKLSTRTYLQTAVCKKTEQVEA